MKTVLLLSVVISLTQCAKILGVFPIPSRSHYILGSSLMKGLAEKGHDVTIITPLLEKKPPNNYKEIVLTGLEKEHEKRRKARNFFEQEDSNPFLLLPLFIQWISSMTELTLNHTNVQKLLQSQEHFDVVIIEEFMTEAHKGFAARFNAPYILLSTIGANAWINTIVGNPAPPSYVSDFLLGLSTQMTFKERVINFLFQAYTYTLYQWYMYPQHQKIYDKYFPEAPNFYDVLYNASVVLLNSHTSINQPVPYVPNMIDIGGFHVQPAKMLPEDLQTFLDGAKDGVIYFSMGSNLRSSELPVEKRDAIIKAFAKLKQKVLWKWEEDVLPGQPKNVKLGKWLPQQEILAHPNVKLFITHGGLLSTTETIYHGVPVLAIPIAGDQKLNARRIVNQGFGLVLFYKELCEQTLALKLEELLNNPTYSQNAKTRSQIFHDRQIKPMDRAIYWVEYVARHGGAPHLKVAGVGLPLYKYLLLDVVAAFLVAMFVGTYIMFKVYH